MTCYGCSKQSAHEFSGTAPEATPPSAKLAGCLNLVTNAVVLWKTVDMTAVIEQLHQTGYLGGESHLADVWPTLDSPINVYGEVSQSSKL